MEWIYNLAATPVIGQIFVNTLITPFGLGALDKAVENVFAPVPVPENYIRVGHEQAESLGFPTGLNSDSF